MFVCQQHLLSHIINPRIYYILRGHVFFLLIYFIKIYNLYFLFLYIIPQVKIHYKRKKIHSEKIVKLKILLILILILIAARWQDLPKILLYFTSHPKFYKKTYVECKIIQTSLGNYIFQTITSIFYQNISINKCLANSFT